MQPQQPNNQPLQQPTPAQPTVSNQPPAQQMYAAPQVQQQTNAMSVGKGKKVLYTVGGIVLALLGLQGLIAQTVNSTHGIVTVLNLALFLLGGFLVYEPFKRR